MAGVKGKGTLFTEKEYKKIKEILNVGVSIAKTAKIVDRSEGLVGLVSKTNSFKEYQEYNRARFAKAAEKKAEEKVAPVVKTNDDKFIEVLVRVADSLERLADAWETPLERTAKESRLFGRK